MGLYKSVISFLIYTQMPLEVMFELFNVKLTWLVFSIHSVSTLYAVLRVVLLVNSIDKGIALIRLYSYYSILYTAFSNNELLSDATEI